MGVGNLAREGMRLNSERDGGREATLNVGIQSDPSLSQSLGTEKTTRILDAAIARHGFTHSTQLRRSQGRFQFPRGVQNVELTVADPPYGVMHRVNVTHCGRFAADDADRLAPAVVVNEAFYLAPGWPDLTLDPQVPVLWTTKATSVIIGVVPVRN